METRYKSSSVASLILHKPERKIIEKNRRNEMKFLYSQLLSLLPDHVTSKGCSQMSDRVNNAIQYIHILKVNLAKSKDKKEALLNRKRLHAYTSSESQVISTSQSLNIQIHDISPDVDVVLITGLKDHSIYCDILRFLDEYSTEVVHANFCAGGPSTFHVHHKKIEITEMYWRLHELFVRSSNTRASSCMVDKEVINLGEYMRSAPTNSSGILELAYTLSACVRVRVRVRQFENSSPYDMIQKLKSMFEKQVGVERNHNIHNIGKTIGELHALIIKYDKGLPKKAATPQVLAIQGGRMQKSNKKSQNAKRKVKEKDDACHHCKEVGHWKRNCLMYLAELMKKKKHTGSASTSAIFTIELFSFPNKSWVERSKPYLDSTYLWHYRFAHITQEIWLHVEQIMKGSSIGDQEKKARLLSEWEKFNSTEGESIESYYHRFSKLMNNFSRNKHFPEKIANNFKPTLNIVAKQQLPMPFCGFGGLLKPLRRKIEQGFPLFDSESLMWPGSVEFDNVNGKVLTYSAQDRQGLR
nr:transcription factor bHLH162-like [Tanacetum cinerariifolium]